jgi:TPR repeat protein
MYPLEREGGGKWPGGSDIAAD